MSINDAITGALLKTGFRSGYACLERLAVEPLKYVIPAPAPDSAHAAWYSKTYAPQGHTTIDQAGAIVGWRDDAPFIHCHGLWTEVSGERRMGHLLPLDSVLAQDAVVEAWCVSGARFEVRDDPETNFRLFAPVVDAREASGSRGLLCTVRPNEDIAHAVQTACRKHGIVRAAVHGIGSLVGADFADGTHVSSHATEVLVTRGEVNMDAAGPHCRLEVALVDMDGAITQGLLTANGNTVCVTFELLIAEI